MTDVFDLSGKVALVTGANGGIGLGIAEALAAAGAEVCGWGRNPEKNRLAQERLSAIGPRTAFLQCDASDEEQVEKAFVQTLELFGHVDACFVNHAVGAEPKPFAERTTAEWHEQLGVNLFGVIFVARAAVRHMIDRGQGGSLILMSSSAVVKGQVFQQPYLVSKAAMPALARSLAVELSPYGIRANSIQPGWIETPMTQELFDAPQDTPAGAFSRHMLRRIPAKRWGEPRDFAGVAVYLMSEASIYHTGDNITLDGGFNLT